MDPRTATTIACWWLAALGMFTLVHAVALLRQWIRRPMEHQLREAGRRVAAHMKRRAAEVSWLLERWGQSRRDTTLPLEEKASRRELVVPHLRRHLKVNEDLTVLEIAGESNPVLSDTIEHVLADSRGSNGRSIVADAATGALKNRAGWWRARLFIPFVAGAPSGAAPTMTGCMTWLSEVQQQQATGIQAGSYSGLNEALGTTAAGCAITVVAVLLMHLAHRLLCREREALCEEVRPLLDQRTKILELRRQAELLINGRKRVDHVQLRRRERRTPGTAQPRRDGGSAGGVVHRHDVPDRRGRGDAA